MSNTVDPLKQNRLLGRVENAEAIKELPSRAAQLLEKRRTQVNNKGA